MAEKTQKNILQNNVSSEMRQLEKFLLAMKSIHPVKDLEDCIRPDMFEKVIEAVKVRARYDDGSNTYKTSVCKSKG